MSNQAEASAKIEADRRSSEILEKSEKAKADELDPGKNFTFLAGKKLPTGFINPEPGKLYHRCVDQQGSYRPDWISMRAHKTDAVQADRIYAHAGVIRGPNKAHTVVNNYVKTGVWLDAPKSVLQVVSESMREIVDMVDTDSEGRPLALTGPSTRFAVTEERPWYNCEVRTSA
jgi:hypothetical protein